VNASANADTRRDKSPEIVKGAPARIRSRGCVWVGLMNPTRRQHQEKTKCPYVSQARQNAHHLDRLRRRPCSGGTLANSRRGREELQVADGPLRRGCRGITRTRAAFSRSGRQISASPSNSPKSTIRRVDQSVHGRASTPCTMHKLDALYRSGGGRRRIQPRSLSVTRLQRQRWHCP